MSRPFMKGRTEFWILMICGTVVSLLMLREIFLSHAIIVQQHVLVDYHETSEMDAPYESAWEKLALRVYKASEQDPAMAALLKSEQVTVHLGPPPGSEACTNGAPSGSSLLSPTSSKPIQAPHP